MNAELLEENERSIRIGKLSNEVYTLKSYETIF